MAIIDKPSDYFNTKLYTGTGSELAVTGVGFQPDWIWFKQRDAIRSNALVDSVRGRSKVVFSDLTNAEETSAASTNDLVSFDSDGFTVGITNVSGSFNTSSGSHVAWNWKAGGTASSNTDGSITSSVSANTTSGFSIVSYTGTGANATVGHGLGVAPSMIITKPRSNVYGWIVYHKSNGATQYMVLNETAAVASGSTNYQDTTPTSSVVSIGTNSGINPSSSDMIMYCFAEKQGYSKFGSYTGNGNANGTFVYTGFKPAFVMLKSSSSGAVGWITHDNKRIGFNPNNYYVEPNNSNAESADTDKILLLSNGFKLISTSASWNSSGGTYIYMAFAENPFVTSTTNGSIPATAR